MTLKEYLRMPWTIDIESQEDGDGLWLEVTVYELEGLHVSVSEGEDLREAFYEGLECHLEAMLRDEEPITIPSSYRPSPISLGQVKIRTFDFSDIYGEGEGTRGDEQDQLQIYSWEREGLSGAMTP